MKVLVVGSGGREHALCWKIAQSPFCEKLFCAPGNGGTGTVAENVPLVVDDIEGLLSFCDKESVDFVVVGPELPLTLGLSDRLTAKGILCFGASQAAAALEGSKAFMKQICTDYNIPTAAYGTFTETDAAKEFIATMADKVVVKADGLAAGKGVIMCENHDQAFAAVDDMLAGNTFGEAGNRVIIEEWLEGEELSYFALTDGKTVLSLTSAQDHKRAFDGDQGPNTGGMGACSPAPMIDEALEKTILETAIYPTVQAMADKGTPYVGVLYAGFIITAEGPKLLEYNVRFGDPECQVLLPRLKTDLLPVLKACAQGTLDRVSLEWAADVCLTVVMAAKGYPGSYEKGSEIRGLDQVSGAEVFHAGTKVESDKVLANGGRVLNVTASGKTVQQAQSAVYAAIEKIDWPQGFYRTDIGHRALKREQAA